MKTNAVLRNVHTIRVLASKRGSRNLRRSGRSARPDSGLRMNGKPYRQRIGARPFNAVARMSLYEDMIAGPKVSILRLAFKTQASGAREHRNPLIPGLVIPEARRTGLPRGDDALDPHSGPTRISVMPSSDPSAVATSAKRLVVWAIAFAESAISLLERSYG